MSEAAVIEKPQNKPMGLLDFIDNQSKAPSEPPPQQVVAKDPPAPKEKPQAPEKKEAVKVPPKEVIPDAIAAAITGEKAAEAPKEEAVQEIPQDLIDKAPQTQREAMVKMNKKLKDLHHERTTLKAEIEAFKKAGGNPAELTKYQDELKTLKQQLQEREAVLAEKDRALAVADLTSTEQFKSVVSNPMKNIGDRVDSIASKNKASTKDIFEAFRKETEAERNTALQELAAEFDEPDRMKLYIIGEQFAEIEAKRKELMKAPTEALTLIRERQQQAQAEGRERMKQQWSKAVDDTKGEIAKSYNFYREIEGNDEWNTQIRGIDKFVSETDWATQTPHDLASMAYGSALLPMAAKIAAHYAKEARTLQKELEAYRQATPNAGGGSPSQEVAKKADNKGFMEHFGLE